MCALPHANARPVGPVSGALRYPPCPWSPLSSLRESTSTPSLGHPTCPLLSPPCPRSPLSSLRGSTSTPWTTVLEHKHEHTSEVITTRKASSVRVRAPGRTRAVSACTTRATRLARTRRRARPLGACQYKLGRTACDRSGMRRVGRARRGDAGLLCLANACGEGPSPKARKSCTSCTSAGAVPQPVAVIRACWADRRPARRPRGVHGARFSSRWGLCVAHGRSGGTTGRHRRQQLPAEAGCWYLFQGR